MKITQRYETSDGKEFKDAGEAAAHQKGLDVKAQLDGYLAGAGIGKAQAGLLRKHIPGYLAHVEAAAAESKVDETVEA